MNYVLDACSLIAYLRKENGGEIVRDLLLESKNQCSIHALNLCEVYYDFERFAGRNVADEVIEIVSELGIDIIEDMDESLWKLAGHIKATIKRISLADTFAIALSLRLKASLVTTDHKEFDRIDKEKICKVLFIR
jgi:PIN domain nuclease of toxin-antitoxin system